MATLHVVPNPEVPVAALAAVARISLYCLEDQTLALAESVEMVPPEQEGEFIAEFGRALSATKDKRDSVSRFCSTLQNQISFASAEIRRLQERKSWLDKTLERVEYCVVSTIKSLYQPAADGTYQRLEGNTSAFGLRACPATVGFTDEALVPSTFKTFTLKVSATKWEQLLDSLDVDVAGDLIDAVRKAEVSIDKPAVRAALIAGMQVPGAHLVGDTLETRKHNLVRS